MINDDGTIDVRVVLTVQVDPNAWAQDMMGRDALQKEIRRDVKRWVRDRIGESDNEYLGDVSAQGLYDDRED